MKITKRDGRQEAVKFDKITARLKKQTYDLNTEYIDVYEVSKKVIEGIYDGITTKELDILASETSFSLTTVHPDYSQLASRVLITSLYKEDEIKRNFSESIEQLYFYINKKTGEKAGLISDDIYNFIIEHKDILDGEIVGDRDFLIDYFGFKTLDRSYLLKIDGKIAETPQYMWMRVACGIWGGKDGNIEKVIKTYELLSQKCFTHATPTLFNSGTKKPQMSSCFLLDIHDDSIKGIYKTVSDCADISQSAGGIGLAIHKIRGKGAYIKGTNGVSNGIIPMIRVFNETARYVDQGGQKRKGAIAIYLEPWHSDIEDFLDLRKNQGKEEMRARDIFTALWIPDLFFERVQDDSDWSLFSPDEAPGLHLVYGQEFNDLYTKYENEGRARKVVKARYILEKIQDSQLETGTPYMLSKDASNMKSNQKNIGIIQSSNLCTEILEVSSPDETAVCNLASISLPSCIERNKFNHEKLHDIVYQATENLNRVIDVNYYPTKETKISNMKHRPIGIGVQGLADAFAILGYPFDSEKAKKLNREIFETIYYASLRSSCDSSKEFGPYETFNGSPASKGILQYDMWEEREVGDIEFVDDNGDIKKKMGIKSSKSVELSKRWNWDELKEDIKNFGLRNSLNIAPMPTVSTSQILGNNESFEPITSNIFKRNTLSGEFVIVNKYLVKDLIKCNLWNKDMKDKIILNEGSIQNIEEISSEIKEKYKTIWEIKQKDLIDMSADRGFFICQSQSFNLHVINATKAKLTSAILYGWLKGLKTLSYYTRTKSIVTANKGFGMDTQSLKSNDVVESKVFTEEEKLQCSLDNPEDCIACGS